METNLQHYKDTIQEYIEIDNKFFYDIYNGTIGYCSDDRCTSCIFRELNRNSYGYSCHYAQMINEWCEHEYQPIVSIDYKRHHFDYNPATWRGRDDLERTYSSQNAESAIKTFKERIDKLLKNVTNYGYFARDIQKLTRLGLSFAVTEDEEVLPCWDAARCSKCIFDETKCNIEKLEWADRIYGESKPINWADIPIDTEVLVREHDGDVWQGRYFAGYINGKPYVWSNGATSWSVGDKDPKLYRTSWKFTKLYEED